MADLTPAEITAGTPSDGSLIHASEDGDSDNSRAHNETDISRLRSAIKNFDSNKTYQPGDLVRHFNSLWRAIDSDITVSFDPNQWEVVSPNLKQYSENREYGVGALIIGTTGETPGLNGVQLRSATLQTAGAFNRADWVIADGVGVKNVKHVFSEADFPPVTQVSINGATAIDVHELEDGVSYLISDTFTINAPLFIGINIKTELFEIGQGLNVLAIPDGGIITQPLTSGCEVDNDGAGTLTVTTDVAHNLVNTDTVNVRADLTAGGAYNLEGVSITNLTTFTFDITGQPGGPSNVIGRWDRGALEFQLANITLRPIAPTGAAAIDIVMSQAGFTRSELVFENVRFQSFNQPNKITNGDNVFLMRINILNFAPFTISSVRNLIIEDVTGVNDVALDLFEITGNATNFVNVTDVIVDIPSTSQHMFAIPQSGVSLPDSVVDPELEFHIHDSKDLNVLKSTLFSPDNGGLNQSDVNFFVHDNGNQRDSLTFADVRMDTSVPDGAFSPDPMLGDPVNIDDDVNGQKLWSFASEQRFSMLETSSGEIEYIGIKDIELLINYSVSIRVEGSGTQHQKYFISAYHSPESMPFTEITNARIFGTQIDETIFATGTITINQPVTALETVTIGSDVYTAVSSSPSNFEFDISSNINTTIADNLKSTIDADGTGDYTAISGSGIVTITSTGLPGTIGNSIVLASSQESSMATSGSFLTGGEDSGIMTISGSVFVDMETGDRLRLQAGNLTSNNIADLFFVSAASMAIHELE